MNQRNDQHVPVTPEQSHAEVVDLVRRSQCAILLCMTEGELHWACDGEPPAEYLDLFLAVQTALDAYLEMWSRGALSKHSTGSYVPDQLRKPHE